jgi:hypothetical protein
VIKALYGGAEWKFIAFVSDQKVRPMATRSDLVSEHFGEARADF